MDSNVSRHRRAAANAARSREDERRKLAIIAASGLTYERLCDIADDRGWTLVITVRKGRMTLHAFAGAAPTRGDRRAWRMPPAGRQLASADVENCGFDAAAAALWLMYLQEWT